LRCRRGRDGRREKDLGSDVPYYAGQGADGNREPEYPGRASQQALNDLKVGDEHQA
jgi:hypothetical protein